MCRKSKKSYNRIYKQASLYILYTWDIENAKEHFDEMEILPIPETLTKRFTKRRK